MPVDGKETGTYMWTIGKIAKAWDITLFCKDMEENRVGFYIIEGFSEGT